MKVTIKMKKQALKQLLQAHAETATQTAEKMLEENKPNMPYLTGELIRSTKVDSTKVKNGVIGIVSKVPYAKRVYFHPEGKNAEWWNAWISGSKKTRPKKLFKQTYKKNAGGYVK